MTKVNIKQRFGVDQSKRIEHDFPESARIALAYLLDELLEEQSFKTADGKDVITEALRCGRFVATDFIFDVRSPFSVKIMELLAKLQWDQVYTFCERLYRFHFEDTKWHDRDTDEWNVSTTKVEKQKRFSEELNEILVEENISYRFVDGEFQRQGRAQTQKNMQRVGAVLGQPRLKGVKIHFAKAQKFLDQLPEPDIPNCVKEAVCALEAALQVLSQKPESSDFAKQVKQLQGNGERQIPPPVADGMIKLYAYRGSGQGVAHPALHGNRVTDLEAELVMSLVATYITYLVDLLPEEDEIPF